jgi:hypothetical protein
MEHDRIVEEHEDLARVAAADVKPRALVGLATPGSVCSARIRSAAAPGVRTTSSGRIAKAEAGGAWAGGAMTVTLSAMGAGSRTNANGSAPLIAVGSNGCVTAEKPSRNTVTVPASGRSSFSSKRPAPSVSALICVPST